MPLPVIQAGVSGKSMLLGQKSQLQRSSMETSPRDQVGGLEEPGPRSTRGSPLGSSEASRGRAGNVSAEG